MTPLRTLIGLAAGAAALCLPAAAVTAPAPTVVGITGAGPLRLGMDRAAAVATGWLGARGTGCPLGGTPPVTYRLTGPKAPAALRGGAEFSGGRLTTLTFSRGVRTTTGVTVGSTPARMLERSRNAGYRASSQYVETLQGTFVTVTRRGKQVLGGFASGGRITTLAVPAVPVCE